MRIAGRERVEADARQPGFGAAQRLATSRPADVLANAVLAEEAMVDVYKTALPALPDAKIAMTAATILASHAQHLFILRDAAQVT